MFIIDTLAYTNRLRATHPAEKMLFSLFTLLCVLLTDSAWLLMAILLGMIYFTVGKAGIPSRVYARLLLIPATFIFMGLLPLLIETGQSNAEAWLSIKVGRYWLCVTPATIHQAGELFLKSFASIACFYVLVLSTPLNDVLYVLGKIGVPKTLVEMMSLVYRYIGTFMDTAQQMYISQKNRLGYGSFRKSKMSLSMLTSSVFVRSFVRSETAYNALLSRCYRGEIATVKEMAPVNVRSLVRIIVFEMGLLALVVGVRLW